MHGVIFTGLKEYVETKHGADAWDTIHDAADVDTRTYMSIKTYPDEELVAIVEAAMEVTGATQTEILRDFGQFVGADLLDGYDAFLEDDWSALDVLEHTETAMHKAVRLKEDDAEPPELDCRRPADDEVVIEYASDHQFCKLGEGLIEGIAEEYDADLDVTQPVCMLDHDSVCEIHVQRA